MHKSDNVVIEACVVRKGISGWHILPVDFSHHPLLAALHGHPIDVPGPVTRLSTEDLRTPLEWPSLKAGLAEVRAIARDMGLGFRVCGNLKKSPTLQLWRKPKPAREEEQRPFQSIRGDAAKWGVSDFYAEAEIALKEALKSGGPFDTGWFSVKKELQSGRVRRQVRNGPVEVSARCSMDDWPDLVDSAMWSAAGKPIQASCGFDTLVKLGLTESEARQWVEAQADACWEHSALEEDNSCSDSEILGWRSSYARVCACLDKLAGRCDAVLNDAYQGLVDECRAFTESLKQKQNASCENCKHFMKGEPDSRSHPGDPATCAHPKYFALLSANKSFPFENGCKFWVARFARRLD